MAKPSNVESFFIQSVFLLIGTCVMAPTLAQVRVVTPQEAASAPSIDADQIQNIRRPFPFEVTASEGVTRELERLQELAKAQHKVPNASASQQRDAVWQLGLLQLHGLHVPLNPVQARHNFERAFQLGQPNAPAGLVWCAIDGCGDRPDFDQARQYLPALRKVNPGRAAYFEWLMQDDVAPIGANLPSTAQRESLNTQQRKHQTLMRAVQAGDVVAKMEWGMDLAAKGRIDDALEQFRAISIKSEAARHNIEVLNNQLGGNKSKLSGNPGQAGGAWQTFKQARVYHRGEGVPVNYTEAIRLYKRASDMGSEPAKRMLALVYSRPTADGALDVAWMQQLAYMDVTKDGATPMTAPLAPVSLTRDPTPLYDYIARQWQP